MCMACELQSYALLNCDDHQNFLRRHNKDPALYRPDICHQALLAILDSPLAKSGRLKVGQRHQVEFARLWEKQWMAIAVLRVFDVVICNSFDTSVGKGVKVNYASRLNCNHISRRYACKEWMQALYTSDM